MRHRRIQTAVVVLVVVLACGCGPSGPTAPALRTIDLSGLECAGFGLSGAVLHGAPDDPRVAWVEIDGGGERAVVFPVGYTARFAPALEILAPDGSIAFREADAIDDACGERDGSLILTK